MFGLLLAGLLFCFGLNLGLGSVRIPFSSLLQLFFESDQLKPSWKYILINHRLPKALTATMVGAGLGVSGLLMQTLFRNPLAGPFVLGISSGASFGVALLILSSGFITAVFGGEILSGWSLVTAAAAGSFLILVLVLTVSNSIRDTMAILIIGLMFGSITTAVVSVLAFFSTAEKLQQYIFWSFGSLGNLRWNDLGVFSIVIILGLLLSVFSLKGLNALLLGESYAQSLGLHLKKHRLLVIIATSLLAGVVTAFAGPIAFIGLAVPHIVRLFFNTNNHKVLLPATVLFGAILMLLCDTAAQLPQNEQTLPINAVTAIVGAPVVIWLLVRNDIRKSLS